MTGYQKAQCEEIIERYKIQSGIKGSKMSLSDLMTDMVVEIGEVFGFCVRYNMPSELRTYIFSYTVGSAANRFLTGWIPFVGTAVNHASAAVCTAEVGEEAVKYFDARS